ncbi:MAG: sulfate adenylyltransferase subunit CysN, partial [Providencia sp.]|nr:sulfate adenylyltransferase subunit CysN [Providencia sp.]
AYRYFSTEKRKFIIADTPGHEQYTRNMATGASTCSLSILLIDARKGVQEQTRRHSFISTLLGIRHLIVAVNKMDLVEYSEAVFDKIKQDYQQFATELPVELNVWFVPISALDGDNIVNPSEQLPWYQGETLLSILESVQVEQKASEQALRFPVQYVNRPNLDFRGYSGTLSSGIVQVGQAVKVLPSGATAKIKEIVTFSGLQDFAIPGEAITLVLDDEIDISRGDLIVAENESLQTTQHALIDVVWMAEQPLVQGQQLDIKIAGKRSRGKVENIQYQVDVNNLTQKVATELPLNGIGLVEFSFDEPLLLENYQRNADTGGMIFIDRLTNVTVGAGLVREAQEPTFEATGEFSEFEIELNQLIRRHFPHWGARDVLGGK